ncbi:hypothetical protein BDW71DRAFT_182711 [Aspergillus fruticulosus]
MSKGNVRYHPRVWWVGSWLVTKTASLYFIVPPLICRIYRANEVTGESCTEQMNTPVYKTSIDSVLFQFPR